MIPRILAALFLAECRAFLCALTAAAVFLTAGLLFASLGITPGAAVSTFYAFPAFFITFHYEKPKKPTR